MPKGLSRSAYDAHLPDGAAWEIAPDSDSDKLFDGLGEIEDGVKDDLEGLALARDPNKTTDLESLEKEYGILTDPTLTEAQRRANLAALVYATRGTGSKSYLQARLHEAGYTDFFVYDNDPVADPDPLITPNGEYVVNGDIYSQSVDYEAACGISTTVCGNNNAVCGNFISARALITYTAPPPGDTTPVAPYALTDGDMSSPTVDDWDPVWSGNILPDGRNSDPAVTWWSVGGTATLSKVTGVTGATYAQVLDVNAGVAGDYAQSIAPDGTANLLIVGNDYQIRIRARGSAGTNPEVWDGTTQIWAGTTDSNWQDSGIITFTASDTKLQLIAAGGILNVQFDFVELNAETSVLSKVDFGSGNFLRVESHNQLVNGDMELGTAGYTPFNAALSERTREPHTGTKSLRVTPSIEDGSARQTVLTVGDTERAHGFARSVDGGVPKLIHNGVEKWVGEGLRIAGGSGVANLSSDVTINSQTVSPTFRYIGDGASLTEWVADVGDDLPVAGTSNDPTFLWGYGTGAKDIAVKGNIGKYYEALGSSFGNVGTNDFVLEFVVYRPAANGTRVALGKRDASGGYDLRFDATGVRTTLIGTGGSANIYAPSITEETYVHIIGLFDNSGSGILYANNVKGTAVSISALGNLDSTVALSMLARNGLEFFNGTVQYAAMWQKASWLDSHLQDAFAAERFHRFCGTYDTDLAASPTFTRTTPATMDRYISSENRTVLIPVGAGMPRVSDLDASFRGYQAEGAGTNLVTYSDDLQTGWSKTEATINTATGVATPEQVVDYQGIVGSVNDVVHEIFTPAIAFSGSTYCASAIVKDGLGGFRIRIPFVGDARWDLTTGTLNTSSGMLSTGIESFGDDSYLCWCVFTGPGSSQSVYMHPIQSNGTLNYIGDGVTVDLHLAGAQVELGSYPSSRIKTAGATATRNADDLDGAAPGPWQEITPVEFTAAATTIDYAVGNITGAADFDDLNVTELFNRVADGGMEMPTTQAWTPGGSSPIAKDTSEFFAGAQSLRIPWGGTANSFAEQIGAVQVGKRYHGVGYAKSTPGSEPRFSDGAIYVWSAGADLPNWTFFDVAYTASGSRARYHSIGSSGEAWFDSVQVLPIDVDPQQPPAATHPLDPGQQYFFQGLSRSEGIQSQTFKNGTVEWYSNPATIAFNSFERTFTAEAEGELIIGDTDLAGRTEWDDFVLTDRVVNRAWNLIFLVGGAVTRDPDGKIVSIEAPQLSSNLRANLLRIILRVKPLQTWCALAVEYI
jgi:hypothetical protein